MADSVQRPKPLFIPGVKGQLFVIATPARETHRGTLICVPPFAEEMNKSRRALSVLAGRAANQGWQTVLFDFYGTGDSEGDFLDTDWAGWCEDLNTVVDWVESQGQGMLNILAVRAGALIATEWLTAKGSCDRLILWQPVTAGKQHLGQFLRLRVMANRFKGINESIKTLTQELVDVGELEVAGYRLSQAFFQAMEGAQMKDKLPRVKGGVNCFEIGLDSAAPSRPLGQLIETWSAGDIVTTFESIADEPFWSTQEISTPDALINRTLALLNPADVVA